MKRKRSYRTEKVAEACNWKVYLGIWKAISSSESLGCRGARSKSLLGPRWIRLQHCMDSAVGWDWSVWLVPSWPPWLPLPCFCRFLRTSSAWRRRLCSRKKYIDMSAFSTRVLAIKHLLVCSGFTKYFKRNFAEYLLPLQNICYFSSSDIIKLLRKLISKLSIYINMFDEYFYFLFLPAPRRKITFFKEK